VVSNWSCHLELNTGHGLEVEIIEQTNIYVKVPCKKQPAPAKFLLEYQKD